MIKTGNSLEFSLSQKQSHVLALGQLKSLKLLQLSAVELGKALTEIAERNPFLEVKQKEETVSSFEDIAQYDLYDNDVSSCPVEITPDENTKLESSGRLSQDDFVLSSASSDHAFENDAAEQGLHDSLLFELNLTSLSPRDKEIGRWIIDGIDDAGFLQVSPDEIAAKLPECSVDEVLSVLKLIRHFELRGVGSRNVKEFLLLQLKDEPSSPLNSLCILILSQYENLLIKHDINGLKTKIKCNDETLKKALEKLASLKPCPYIQTVKSQEMDVVPDLIVTKVDTGFKVELNTDKLPKVFINKQCLKLRSRARDPKDIKFFKDNLEEARFIVSGLSRRYETLLTLGRFIFIRQKDFLLSGKDALNPLTLKECALALGVHESTVSRAVAQKYVLTPFGTFPLKFFFAVGFKKADDNSEKSEKSGTAVLAMIEKFIKTEDKRKPLSDSKIALLLKKEGISIARRTVAKYREKLRIASAAERKIF